jgi:Tol biopolymer transport system component
MTAEHWERIKELFGAALERPPKERYAFLVQACGEDYALRDEVLRLLAEENRPDSLLDKPVVPLLGITPRAGGPLDFDPGQIVSARYKIVRLIGRGGMGQVYEAEDLELREPVALKTLLPEIAEDNRAIERFKREILARKVAHPNVCRVFDLGYHVTSSGSKVAFLTMELLAGATLAERLKEEGRMSTAEALPIINQVAEGLAAAHQAGIIHRDFKCRNVILVPAKDAQGRVRAVITDFGLARHADPRESAGDSGPGTGRGMGTPDYMAPEQVGGEQAGPAADIYALGVVIYEMVTGALPFEGETPLEVAVRRLKEGPIPPRSRVPELDPNWEKVILRCLERHPGLRFETALDVASALRGGCDLEGAPVRTDGVGRRAFAGLLRRHPMRALAVSVAVLVLALGYWFVRPLPAPLVINYEPLTHDGNEKHGPLVTDGPRLYFEEKIDGKWMLAVIPSGGGTLSTYPLPSPEVSVSDVAPDGSDLLGWGVIPGLAGPRLLVWSAPGGSLENPAGLHGEYPTWSPDRTSVAYSDGVHSLFVAGRRGENPRKVASVDGCPQYVRWSPDGRSLRFSQLDPKSEANSLWEVPVVGGQPQSLLARWNHGAADPRWTADGSYSLFESGPAGETDIWARRENCNPFRWRRREPMRITAGPLDYSDPVPSRDGSKLFVLGQHYGEELVRYDLKSKTFVPYLPALLAADPDYSPDGEWVAYARLSERTLWRSRPDGSDAVALTVTGARVYSPHWSPDGKQIAYVAISAQNQYKAYVVPAEGGQPQQLLPGAGEEGIPTWSHDGNFLVFGDVLHGLHASEMAIHVLDLDNHRLSTLPGSNGLWTPRWSPDGRHIAALALGDEAKGQLPACPAVLLYDFRTRRWTTLASVPGIRNLAWPRESQYVYFRTGGADQGMYRVHIVSKIVEPLVSLRACPGGGDDWFGMAADGSLLIMKDTKIQEVYALDMQWH